MTRFNSASMLRRAYEHTLAFAAAIAVTVLLLVSVNARAATPARLTPSVSILVPTVTIEPVEGVVESGV
jgi:hypothetical protein